MPQDSVTPLMKVVGPVDKDGLRFNQSSERVLWKALTNTVARDGVLRPRPGLTLVGPATQDVTNGPRPIVAITETTQYANERVLVAERLPPDATVSAVNWTGTHADIDEDPPDGVDVMATSTPDAAMTVTFTNLSATPDAIDEVYLHLRARSPNNGVNSLELQYPSSGTVIDTLLLANGEYEDTFEATEPNWLDFFIPIQTADSGIPWTTGGVNGFSLKTILRAGTYTGTAILTPATGTDDDFDSGTDWQRTDGTPDAPIVWFGDWQTITNGTVGDRISWIVSLDNPTKWTSVDQLTARAAVGTTDGQVAVVQLYHKGTDNVRRDLGDPVTIYSMMPNGVGDWLNPGKGIAIASSTAVALNPETGLAWTVAELQAGVEVGLEIVTGNVAFSSGEVVAEGQITTANIEIDTMALYVSGRDFQGANNGDTIEQWRGRIMATPSGFQRLVEESPLATDALEDILGAETAPTSGARPWDTAVYFDRIYYCNGIDLPYFYEGKTIGNLSSGTPIGKTIFNFGQRLMQADMLDSGTRSIKRVAYSGIAAPDDWTADDAGDFDLTMGGVGRIRKGLALGSTVAALYLDQGLYTVRWTGDDDAPFVPSLVDGDTGIVAPATCLAVQDDGGTATHLFLGQGPEGLNVYAFNGASTQAIGNEIQRDLERLSSPGEREYAFAGLDPIGNYYLLFVAESGQTWPKQSWVYDIATGRWYRWEFPFYVTSAGQWTLHGLHAGGTLVPNNGTRQLVLGTSLGVPYKFDYDVVADVLSPVGDDLAGEGVPRLVPHGPDSPGAPYEQRVNFDIQTGDLTLATGNIVQLSAVKQIWLTYEDFGRVDIEVSVSTDGGETYLADTVVETFLGAGAPGDFVDSPLRLREKVISIPNPTAGRTHSVRIRPAQTLDADKTSRQQLRITQLIVEFEDLGDLP